MRVRGLPGRVALAVALIGACFAWAEPSEAARRKAPHAESRAKAPAHGIRLVKPRKRAASARQPRYRVAKAAPSLRSAALRSSAALILDPANAQILFAKNPDTLMPIASITKLMTATVVIESRQDLAEMLTVTRDDVDRVRYSSSRLRIGTRLSRADLLHIALMSSENRAASALARNYPGGVPAFVTAMNDKARALGMARTRYVDPTGLSSGNVSTPAELATLVVAAARLPLIRSYSTTRRHAIKQGSESTTYRNSNRLIANRAWKIGLQKTGYISEAGRCLVMQATVAGRPVVMVFLDSQGKFSRAADATRVRTWLESRKLDRTRR
jgi:D-alanyl-D-alanine endopeptidase (penicillin-binding protein 7)